VLRCASRQSWLAAGLALSWIAMAGCADRNTPVSAAAREDPGNGIVEGLSGRVTTHAGAPVVGALIQPRSLDGDAVPEMAVVTEDDGGYSWTLGPGRYEVSVSAEGFTRATKPATVRKGQQTTLDFTLTPER
jgi:hypothetical protein